MRRMNYPRFDKPVNFGEIDSELNYFYLDHIMEAGIYMVIIRDPVDKDIYTLHLTIKDNCYAYADFTSALTDSKAKIAYIPDENNRILVDQNQLSAGSTIEFYKLN